MQDALVNLWLLRQTDFFVGTARSSFSELAILGRNVPSVTADGTDAPIERMERFLHWTGLSRLLDEMTIREFGERYPVRLCWHRRRIRAQARMGRLFGKKRRW